LEFTNPPLAIYQNLSNIYKIENGPVSLPVILKNKESNSENLVSTVINGEIALAFGKNIYLLKQDDYPITVYADNNPLRCIITCLTSLFFEVFTSSQSFKKCDNCNEVYDESRIDRVLEGHNNVIKCLVSINKQLVSGDVNGTVIVWKNGEKYKTLDNSSTIESFTVFNNQLVLGLGDKSIAVWNDQWECKKFNGHTDYATDFTVFKGFLHSCSFDGEVRMWDENGQSQLIMKTPFGGKSLKVIDGQLKVLLFSHSVINCYDNSQCIPKRPEFDYCFQNHELLFENCKFSEDTTSFTTIGDKVVCGLSSGCITIYNKDGSKSRSLNNHNSDQPIKNISIAGNKIITVDANKNVQIWSFAY
ncbi:MAG: hypothetical protein JHC93_04755, partial [Parachlamydiales bacterium]|nr:hypothetical protein [Parachlamydiales bacterium]